MIRKLAVLLILIAMLSPSVFAETSEFRHDQIEALKKRIEELRKEVKIAEKEYEESVSISFDQYMDTVKGVGKEMAGKIHVMRNKMDYEEEKFKIKKRFQELKEELKNAETRLMVLKA